jgi:molecular chaperone GrpE (heat shock protein)
MQLSAPKIAVYLTLIFGAGVATGFFGNRLVSAPVVSASPSPSRNNDDWRRQFTESMRVRLSMSEAQMKQLNEILDETRVEYRLLRKRYKPEMDQIHQGQVEKIKKLLQNEQLPEFDKMEREREEKMRARESGPGV